MPPVTTMARPVAVFGPDDRVPLPSQYKRQQDAIGVLFNIRSRSVCSAFCVADAIIVTAGHCLFKTQGEKPPRLEDFWFARNYDQLRDYARIAGYASGVAAQHVVAGSMALRVAPPIDATSDWALVKLARPVCSKAVLDVLPSTAKDLVDAGQAGRVFQIAYHRDFTLWKQAYSKPCSVQVDHETADQAAIAADFSNPASLVLHRCDTGGASSGSPLLIETAAGPKVAGINVGTYVQSKVIMRGGQTVERLKPETIANTGVAAIAFQPALESFKAATILTTAAAIKDLQAHLARSGHYQGPLDGAYGIALRAAILAFEAAERLPSTGMATEALLMRARAAARR